MRYHRGPDDNSIYVDANTRIQILETMMDLPTADKEQNAAFIVSGSTWLERFCGQSSDRWIMAIRGMNVSWSSGPTRLIGLSLPVTTSRSALSNFYGGQGLTERHLTRRARVPIPPVLMVSVQPNPAISSYSHAFATDSFSSPPPLC